MHLASARCILHFTAAVTDLAAACNNYKTIHDNEPPLARYEAAAPCFSFCIFFFLYHLFPCHDLSFVPFSARGNLIIYTFSRISLLLIHSYAHRYRVPVLSIFTFFIFSCRVPPFYAFPILHENIYMQTDSVMYI